MNQPLASLAYNARLARWLFANYSLVYLAFVLVNGFAPNLVEWKPAGGVNLAIWWGFGLIVLAFLEAMVYGLCCKAEPPSGTDDRSSAVENPPASPPSEILRRPNAGGPKP
jgi:uncharacterized membrane protein (DUF485 family)